MNDTLKNRHYSEVEYAIAWNAHVLHYSVVWSPGSFASNPASANASWETTDDG